MLLSNNDDSMIEWLKGSLCGVQFPKIVTGKSNNTIQKILS
jgi:hypothetical protein